MAKSPTATQSALRAVCTKPLSFVDDSPVNAKDITILLKKIVVMGLSAILDVEGFLRVQHFTSKPQIPRNPSHVTPLIFVTLNLIHPRIFLSRWIIQNPE